MNRANFSNLLILLELAMLCRLKYHILATFQTTSFMY